MVLRSKMEEPRPDKFAFAQLNILAFSRYITD